MARDKTFYVAVFKTEHAAKVNQEEMTSQHFDVAIFGPVPDVVLQEGDQTEFDTSGTGNRWVVTAHNQT